MTENIGSWEKHTKGIGSKLLAKFGFTGRLGANEDGMAKAIDVVNRPARLGLGFGDDISQPDAPAQPKVKRKAVAEANDGWKRSKYSKQPTEPTGRKLLEQIMQDSAVGISTGPGLIIDMRHKERRIVTDLSAAADDEQMDTSVATDGNGFQFGYELLFNLDMLEAKAEQELRQEAALLKGCTQAVQQNHEQVAALRTAEEVEQKQRKQLQQLSQQVGQLQQMLAQRPLRGAEVVQQLACLRGYSTICAGLPLAVFHSLLDDAIGTSSGVREAVQGVQRVCEQMQHLLGSEEEEVDEEVRQRAVEQKLVPLIRSHLLQQPWGLSTAEEARLLVEEVQPLLSNTSYGVLLQGTVVPRLLEAMAICTAEEVHRLLLPWLRLLSKEVRQEVLPAVRRKLEPALRHLLGGDGDETEGVHRGADLLRPWVPVFDATSLEVLLARTALPRLSSLIRDHLLVDPSAQQMQVMQAVRAWAGVLSAEQLAVLLRADLLGAAWLACLRGWLALPRVCGEEVAVWYEGWVAALPEGCRQHEMVVEALDAALDLMTVRMQAHYLGSAAYLQQTQGVVDQITQAGDLFTILRQRKQQQTARQRLQQTTGSGNLGSGSGSGYLGSGSGYLGSGSGSGYLGSGSGSGYLGSGGSLRDTLSAMAEQHGLAFVPRIGRDHAGMQVWSFGESAVYLQDGLVYAQQQSTPEGAHMQQWRPIALSDLLQLNSSSSSRPLS